MQSAKTRPGTDCGSDHQLLTEKFRLKLKKVGQTTRPFKYDLHQIPYNYTVEMTTHSSFLAWKFQGQRSLMGYSPWGRKRVEHRLGAKQ